jgi:isoleucyl-tRNA synthetase
MLSPVPSNLNLPSIDHETLSFWEKKSVFQRSIEQREGAKDFVFYDGPPGTNGLPHIGHMMQSSLKDLWPRYKTMQGFRVLRKAGWDTHGLPIEMTSDKELGITSKAEIGTKISEQEYIDHCRRTVFRYKDSWEQAIRRIGRFLDLENDYATYQPYISMGQSPRYLYRDYRVMPFSPRSGTTLSNFEVAQGYKDVTDLTLYVKFKVKNEANTYLTAWTTTPWTLLSNMAVAAGLPLN